MRRDRGAGARLTPGWLCRLWRVCLVPGFSLAYLSVLGAQFASTPPASPPAPAQRDPISPVPLQAAVDPKRVSLGERLFGDVRLSGGHARSCATCHPLDRGGMDGRPRADKASVIPPPRNTPTIFNVGLSATLNWDGSSNDLAAHAERVLLNPGLMNATWPQLLATLRADASYVAAFGAAYEAGLTQANVLDALASFERSLLTPNSRFDRHLRGERDALTAREQEGYRLFRSYGCATCHQGINVGGNMYQRFGVFSEPSVSAPGRPVDLGRYYVTGAPQDREVFRVPSLRNVAVTAPYFHDGRDRTLEDAVERMARVQLGRTLAQEETRLIIQFLHSLTGEYHGRPVAVPRQAP